ncbi:MAG: DNA polymerase I [Gammaproteobacteria bacterium]|nr:DNA polymerase I [Gammaproteobacteria bacterium]
MSAKRLTLIDGTAYLYRAFYALPPLSASDGRPTGAVRGVVAMLRKMLREDAPTHVAVVFDAPGKTFRDELFEAYKANRPHMPDDMAAQMEPLYAVIEALGLPLIQVPGVEADDVIATLALQATEAGFEVEIGTGDKDMAQFVNGHITLVDTMRGTRRDRAGVKERFGVPPERIVDLLALMGDTSDNIPGVPGVGQKTAAKWLNEYGSLDAIRAHADEIKGKVGEKLRANLEQLELSRQLATVKSDVELELGPADLMPGKPDDKKLRKWYRELEFETWLRELAEPEPEPQSAERNYAVVTDEAALGAWIEKIGQADLFAFDTETTSLNYLDARIVGVSFAVAPGEAAYIPLAHSEAAPFERDSVLRRLQPILEDSKRGKLGHHLKYDAHALANHGITLAGIRHDTLLESWVLNPTAGRHDMDSLALRVLDERTITYEEVCGKGRKQIGFEDVPIETAAPYAAEDADVTWRLHETLWPELEKIEPLRKVYRDIELPLVPVLLSMERHGVLIDRKRLAAQSGKLAREMLRLQEAAWKEAGTQFNLDSPAQLGDILFEHLRLPVHQKTPKGKPSTAESVLADLALEHALPQIVLDYRGMAKLRSTYTEKLPTSANPATDRVHTSYNQTGTSTGRLSSSDPNLQNIPVRSEEGRRIRQAFIAPPGAVILAADYSQIELRIMAHLSGDEGLRRAFADGRDIHRATAAEVFGRSLDEVSANERRAAKAINFGLIYGMSAFGLARQLDIPREDAGVYIERYFERYPGVREYMDATRKNAKKRGYVETLFGRRLYVPEIASRNGQRRQAAERAAINAPMQGTAADIIKRAMITTHDWCRADEDIHLVMQVHDELVFEIAEKRLDDAREKIRGIMQEAADLAVPLVVDIGHGANWDEAH